MPAAELRARLISQGTCVADIAELIGSNSGEQAFHLRTGRLEAGQAFPFLLKPCALVPALFDLPAKVRFGALLFIVISAASVNQNLSS